MPVRVVALAAALLSACVDVNYGDTSFQCDEAEPCPDGLSCVAGRCQSGDAVDSGALDGAADATDASPLCVEPIALVDNFDDNTTDLGIWMLSAPGATMVGERGGQLVIAPQASFAMRRFAGYTTNASFDLREARVFVEAAGVTEASTSAQTRLRVGPDDLSYMYIIEEQGMLRMGLSVAGNESDTVSIPYDARAHRWWQIRETAGQSIGETSPDGLAWVPHSLGASPGFVGVLRVDLSAGTTESVAVPGDARFDNLNGGGALDMCP